MLNGLIKHACIVGAYLASQVFFAGIPANAQETPLKLTATVNFNNVTLESALNTLSYDYNIQFSYSSRNIPVDKKINYSAQNKPLGQIITDILDQSGVQFENVNGYLVLMPKTVENNMPESIKPEYYTLSGIVSDSSNSEFLIGASVYIKETGIGTLSNNYGFFSLKLPAGIYTIESSYLGYSIESRQIELNRNIKWNLKLVPVNSLVQEIIIFSENKKETIFNSFAAQFNVKAIEVKQQTAALGETDMLKSLDNLPGISFQGDGSSYFSVRGGNRDQNLILLDEATIYNPSHLLGFFTPIIPEAVKNTEIYKADFPIQYGGRLSSVIDIRTRDGNMQEFSGNFSTGLISTRASFEGPIKKDASSYFFSLRRSHYGFFVKKIVPSIEDLYFRDFTSKFNIKAGKNDRLFLTLFSGKDVFIKKPEGPRNGLIWKNNSLTLRWNHIFGNNLFLNTTFYTSRYDYSLYINYDNKTAWNSHISSNNLKSEFSWYINPSNKIKYGINLGGYFFNPGNINSKYFPADMRISKMNSAEVVIYAGNEQEITPWFKLNYGIRASRWSDIGESFIIGYDNNFTPVDTLIYRKGERFYSKRFVEPRVSVSLKTGEYQSIKASYNRNIQNINLINNSISPFNTLEVWLPSGPNIKPQKAEILNLGYMLAWPYKSLELSADIFYKKMYNQIGYAYHAEMLLNPFLEGELRQGNGTCWGFEFLFRKTLGKLTWHVAYAYNKSFLTIDGLNGGKKFPSHYNKPVDISLMADYRLKPRWTINMNYVYASGMAITVPDGFYYYRGAQVPYYSGHNNGRLPGYHRFDLGSVWQLNKKQGQYEHYLTLNLFNFFADKNFAFLNFSKTIGNDGKFYIPADKENTVYQVPTYRYIYSLVPSLTYNLKF
ncbi:MAG: TonB-dependent receptor [Bacteroidales bacterium]|nr:TonB-dependent receptor [Bacteroidales bacterium]